MLDPWVGNGAALDPPEAKPRIRGFAYEPKWQSCWDRKFHTSRQIPHVCRGLFPRCCFVWARSAAKIWPHKFSPTAGGILQEKLQENPPSYDRGLPCYYCTCHVLVQVADVATQVCCAIPPGPYMDQGGEPKSKRAVANYLVLGFRCGWVGRRAKAGRQNLGRTCYELKVQLCACCRFLLGVHRSAPRGETPMCPRTLRVILVASWGKTLL